MKALLIPLVACATLGGCAVYGDPYGYNNGYNNGYGYGYPAVSGSVYYSNTPDYDRGRGGNRGGQAGQYRDRDRDGTPNRMDYDRDGDGVPNPADSRPNNPRRR
jgi:hypothetical protein